MHICIRNYVTNCTEGKKYCLFKILNQMYFWHHKITMLQLGKTAYDKFSLSVISEMSLLAFINYSKSTVI